VYITVCSSGSLCYSDYVSLYCIKPDGEEVVTYNSPDLRATQGVTTDNHDNVYIVGCLSNNIHRFRPDATPPDCDPVICIFLHTFFLTISINFILSLLLKDTTTILVPGIVVISYGLYLVVIWYWYSLLSLQYKIDRYS
jgi:hypothetical protein